MDFEIIYLNILTWIIATVFMIVCIKKTKDKKFRKCLTIGTCCSASWFFIKNILLPLLNF
jgi:hypothetical protein